MVYWVEIPSFNNIILSRRSHQGLTGWDMQMWKKITWHDLLLKLQTLCDLKGILKSLFNKVRSLLYATQFLPHSHTQSRQHSLMQSDWVVTYQASDVIGWRPIRQVVTEVGMFQVLSPGWRGSNAPRRACTSQTGRGGPLQPASAKVYTQNIPSKL